MTPTPFPSRAAKQKSPQRFRYAAEGLVRTVRETLQDQWFDRTRHVHTSGEVTLRAAGIDVETQRDSEQYQPARPHHIRQALREIPVRNHASYSYVDLGSGKGRSLFLAAELPFHGITGVEFSKVLNDQACANIRTFRHRGRRCHQMASLHANARDFVFPEGRIVLYMFNPFGAETMQVVLDHLAESLRRRPRHAVVVLLWPQCQDQVARMPGMRLVRKTPRHMIFEAHAP